MLNNPTRKIFNSHLNVKLEFTLNFFFRQTIRHEKSLIHTLMLNWNLLWIFSFGRLRSITCYYQLSYTCCFERDSAGVGQFPLVGLSPGALLPVSYPPFQDLWTVGLFITCWINQRQSILLKFPLLFSILFLLKS